MANPSPMSKFSNLLVFLLIITSASAFTDHGGRSTTTFLEYDTVLDSLRNHGYTLFTNAITTSDLQYQLFPNLAVADSENSTSPFTLFAPLDDLLFALDMASDAAGYVNTLRYHIIPNHRHSFGDLKNLSSPFLDTLLPNFSVLIGITQERRVFSDNATITIGVMVDGVRVSNPDLFLGSRIAVHGIDGILLTGLNMNQDLDGNDNGSGVLSRVESPAPLSRSDSNVPPEGTLPHPMSQFGWNTAPAAAPPEVLQGQTQKMKSSEKKKPGKRHHQRGKGHHRRHGGNRRRDDL